MKASVFRAIDLDSFHVELSIMEHHSAENVKRFARDIILFRAGTLAIIHLDHAREIVGRLMTELANNFGCVNISTGRYCPMGNSTIKIFWPYFNICVRNLTDDQYQNIKDLIQHIA